jgi:hypothetical protein
MPALLDVKKGGLEPALLALGALVGTVLSPRCVAGLLTD